ncbi:MAG TPA: glycosyltransferase family 2 protein [Gemmatimonadaceae bacterium]|nr:glycosyltransferase family 2 protein [Gemmatimonadaceae bacterium]
MASALSVIVVSYRRGEELVFCLEDLASQVTDDPFEVVLVLQEYPDGAAQSLRERFGARLDLQILQFPHGLGMPRARNEGLKVARGNIVAFLDDDVRLTDHWASSMLALYREPDVGAVGGYVDHPEQYTPLRKALYRVLGITSNRFKIDWGGFNQGPSTHRAGEQPADWLTGCNMSFRREAIDSVGWFDEGLGTFWHEDVDTTHRVAKAGWRVISSGRMAVKHYPSTINRPPLHKQMRERERLRVLFVWKVIGDRPLWKARYAARLLLQAAAMAVVGARKGDPRIPLGVIRGGWEGYRGLGAARNADTVEKGVTR